VQLALQIVFVVALFTWKILTLVDRKVRPSPPIASFLVLPCVSYPPFRVWFSAWNEVPAVSVKSAGRTKTALD
jgi:hypothetical protein